MHRYKYIGRDGSSGYRTGKKYWAFKPYTVYGEDGKVWRVWFIPFSSKLATIHYTSIERFKADWE